MYPMAMLSLTSIYPISRRNAKHIQTVESSTPFSLFGKEGESNSAKLEHKTASDEYLQCNAKNGHHPETNSQILDKRELTGDWWRGKMEELGSCGQCVCTRSRQQQPQQYPFLVDFPNIFRSLIHSQHPDCA